MRCYHTPRQYVTVKFQQCQTSILYQNLVSADSKNDKSLNVEGLKSAKHQHLDKEGLWMI